MNKIEEAVNIGNIKMAVEAEGVQLLSSFPAIAAQYQAGMSSSESVSYQTTIVRHLLVQMAAVMPLASLGTCHCGDELRFKGKKSGLYACCTGNPEHCWKIK